MEATQTVQGSETPILEYTAHGMRPACSMQLLSTAQDIAIFLLDLEAHSDKPCHKG